MDRGGNWVVCTGHKTCAVFTMMMASKTGVEFHLDTGNYFSFYLIYVFQNYDDVVPGFVIFSCLETEKKRFRHSKGMAKNSYLSPCRLSVRGSPIEPNRPRP